MGDPTMDAMMEGERGEQPPRFPEPMTAPDASLAARLRDLAPHEGEGEDRRLLRDAADALERAEAELRFERGEHELFKMRYEMAVKMRGEVEAEVADWEQSFALYFRALMRGTALWRAAHPGNDLVEPDTGELVAWLLERTERVVSDPVPALLLWWADYLSGVCDGCDLAEDTHATLWVQDLRQLVPGLRAAAGQEPPKEGTT